MMPLNGANSDAGYFADRKLPTDPVQAVGHLNGKSNYKTWQTAMQGVLMSNLESGSLVLGKWTEPRLREYSSNSNQDVFQQEKQHWHTANVATCRFIRATLAENVLPFVRQFADAKSLYLNLVWLYGDESGIDLQGGPPMPAGVQDIGTRRGRAGLLAALEEKKSFDVQRPLPSAGRPITPITPSTISSTASSVSVDEPQLQHLALYSRPNVSMASITEQHPKLLRGGERMCTDNKLGTIPEIEEPHPGSRVRVSSGYAVGAGTKKSTSVSDGSISPPALSELGDVSEVSGTNIKCR
jgi:hypothetical protein